MKKLILTVIVILTLVKTFIWFGSPYEGYEEGSINSEINIESSCNAAFDYLGNSDNARDWSVFVEFIETINPNEFEDGNIGSKRMCYTKADRSGFTWEEEVLEKVNNKYRKISCYNFQNLNLKAPNLVTEQIYTQIPEGCKVNFTLNFEKEPSYFSLLKLKIIGFRVKSIFDDNLENIRKGVLNVPI